MKRTILIAALLLSACSNESLIEHVDRQRAADMAAIPAQIDAEYTARYGADKSKWPKNIAAGIESDCSSNYVTVTANGQRVSGDVIIC